MNHGLQILVGGKNIPVRVLPKENEKLTRLFQVHGSGNFNQSMWRSPAEVIRDLSRQLSVDILQALSSEYYKTRRVTVGAYHPVGWQGFADAEGFDERELQRFKPNHDSEAMMVRKDIEKCAPWTRLVTFVYRLHKNRGLRITVYTMFPGEDIGELSGDITMQKDIVFFPWGHRGENIPPIAGA